MSARARPRLRKQLQNRRNKHFEIPFHIVHTPYDYDYEVYCYIMIDEKS